MEAVPRLPMVSFDLKTCTENVSFGPKLKQYIAAFYHEDPESYNTEIHNLESLRAVAVRPPVDVTGCQTLKRYYSQLRFLKSRFPMEKGEPVAVSFSWKNAYSNVVCTADNVDFELLSILYNIGALHTQLGAADNRGSSEGMKMACTHFQCAAWAYQELKEHFSPVASLVLQSDLIRFMYQLCLAQAQECILEKSMMDNRKSTIIAKVAVQVVDYYKQSLSLLLVDNEDSSLDEEVGSKVFKEWNKYIRFKIAYYSCVALLYQGQQAEEQQKMGERVAFYQAAFDQLEEARKIAKNMSHQNEINEALGFTLDVVEGKRKAAKNENEFIYHEEVPDRDALQEVKGASLVKGIPFNYNDIEVSGPDIFGRLIPMEAHETSSVYSEKKAQMLRQISETVERKDQELAEFMSALKLETLSLYRQAKGLPQEIVDRAAALSAKPQATQSLVDAMAKLANTYHDVEAMLNEIHELIKEEEKQEQEYQTLMGGRPPSIVATDLSREAGKYKEAHSKASESNNNLHKAMMTHVSNLKILAMPLSELQKQIPSIELPHPVIDEKVINDLENMIGKVNEMKAQRTMLLSQLREAIFQDDITSLLVTRQPNQTLDELFEKELQKHQKQVALIEQNLAAQENILRALTDAYANYSGVRKFVSDIMKKRETTINALAASYDAYEDLLAKATKGFEFYHKLETNVSKLLQRIRSTCKVQEEEREQILLKNNKLKRAPAPAPAESAQPASTSAPKLKDYLANMKRDSNVPQTGYYNYPIPAAPSPQPPPAYEGTAPQPDASQWVPVASEGTVKPDYANKSYSSYTPNEYGSQYPYQYAQTYQNYSQQDSVSQNVDDLSNRLTTLMPGKMSARKDYPQPTGQNGYSSYQPSAGSQHAGQEAYPTSSTLYGQYSTVSQAPQEYTTPTTYSSQTVPSYGNQNAYAVPSQQPYVSSQAYTSYPTSDTPANSVPSTQSYSVPTTYTYSVPVTHGYSVPYTQGYSVPTTQSYSVPTTQSYSVPTTQVYVAPTTQTAQAYSVPATYSYSVSTTLPTQTYSVPTTQIYPTSTTQVYQVPTTQVYSASIQQNYSVPTTQTYSAATPHSYQTSQTYPVQTTSYSAYTPSTALNTSQSVSGVYEQISYPNYPGYTYDPSTGQYQYTPSYDAYPQYYNYGTTTSMNDHPNDSYYSKAGINPTSQTDSQVQNMQYYNKTEGDYYSTPYGYQSTGSSSTAQPPTTPETPNQMTYMHSGNSNTAMTYSQVTSPISSDSQEKSNIDLLAELDVSLNQAPLVPQTSRNPETKEEEPKEKPPVVETAPKLIIKEPELVAKPVRKDIFAEPELLNQFVQEVEKFEKYVEGLTNKTLNGPTPLDLKWKEIQDLQEKDAQKQSISVARCYPMKNRFPDILPYDQTRVELPSTKDDYINASFVKPLTPNSPSFIVTQAPLPSTYSDFWTMVWEQQVEVVVCLLNDSELDGHIYWPCEKGQEMYVGQMSLALQTVNVKQSWTERLISIYQPETKTSRVIVHLQFTTWPGSSFPPSPAPFLGLVVDVLNYHSQQRVHSHPVVVHCLSGVGRSGLLCLISAAISDISAGKITLIDVPAVTALMGKQRKNMLRDREHLRFAYQTILYYTQDLLMKHGILTSHSSFEESRTKSHTRHPSQDLILGPTADLGQLQSKLQHMGLDSTNPSLSDSVGQNDSRRSSIMSASSGRASPTSVLDPARFTLKLDGKSKQQKRFTPEAFNSMKQQSLGANSDSSDPLNSLDPLWTIKKE